MDLADERLWKEGQEVRLRGKLRITRSTHRAAGRRAGGEL
jgi:hypothetical protein